MIENWLSNETVKPVKYHEDGIQKALAHLYNGTVRKSKATQNSVNDKKLKNII